MSAFCVYLCLPTYLAQWYAHMCRRHHFREEGICPNTPIDPLTPIEMIRGSHEWEYLHQVLQKQPNAIPAPMPEGATLALTIPYYQDRDPRTYNYIDEHSRKYLEDIILEEFDVCLWKELNTIKVVLRRQDHAIWSFMARYGIACEGTHWDAIAKRYQRKRDLFYKEKSLKNRSSSSRRNRKR